MEPFAEPDSGASLDLIDESEIEEGEPTAAPPVVAVVVTHDPGPWFEATLQQLGEQDYPSLSVLVIDAGSEQDPTARIAAVAPTVYVRRLAENPGFAAAANQALSSVEGATFYLFCHDDIAPEPDAVRILVAEAFRSNAAIVGPKFVDYEQPGVLLDVGQSIDRFGEPYSGLEPGELDQEQHDGVRDAFFVSSAMLLVRCDLYRELEGMDPATFPGGEDLDLCWRAWLLGARVMVVPDAKVRHRQGSAVSVGENARAATIPTRNRLRAVFKCSSTITLLWIVPLALAMHLVETLVLVASRRGARARGTLGAWWWNLRHLGDLRDARRTVQKSRRVPDSDLRPLQVRGSAQLRKLLAARQAQRRHQEHGGQRARGRIAAVSTRLRARVGLGWIALVALAFFGARDFVFSSVANVGTIAPWGSVSGLFHAFTNGWNGAGLGSASPSAPVFVQMGTISALFLGNVAAARTALMVLAIPVGAWGASRLARRFEASPPGALAAAVAYAAIPVGRNAIAHGALGPLASYVWAPWLLVALMRVCDTNVMLSARERRTRVAVLALVVACSAAWYLPILLFLPLVALLWFVLPIAGRDGTPSPLLRWSIAGSVLAAVLLLPWPFEFLGGPGRGAAFGLTTRSGIDLSHVLRLAAGPAGNGWIGWMLIVAALLPILITSDARLAWTVRAWELVLLGIALTWIPARFAPSVSWFSPDATLVPAAVGLALAIGLGFSSLLADLRRFKFGWRQVGAGVAAAVFAFPILGAIVDSLDGRWNLPTGDWASTLSWTTDKATAGDFRTLWVGDPRVLPLDTALGPYGLGFGLSYNGPPTATDTSAPPIGSARWLADALQLAGDGRTVHLGRLLAPAGVRYVAIVDRAAPNAGLRTTVPAALTHALDQQVDLVALTEPSGLHLYENIAYVAVRSETSGASAAAAVASTNDPSSAGIRIDATRFHSLPGGTGPSKSTGPGTVLWSQATDANWQATVNGRSLTRVTAFGSTNAFLLPSTGRVAISYDGGPTRPLGVTFEVLVWLVAIAVLVAPWRARRRERRSAP
jgi:GT2 family glycosyltransferase